MAAPARPGTRFAFGSRSGSPAEVTPLDTGACATSAARQPSSAGDDQASVGVPESGASPPRRLRRNQSDSTDSKIGSRLSAAGLGAGGTITPTGAPMIGTSASVAASLAPAVLPGIPSVNRGTLAAAGACRASDGSPAQPPGSWSPAAPWSRPACGSPANSGTLACRPGSPGPVAGSLDRAGVPAKRPPDPGSPSPGSPRLGPASAGSSRAEGS